MAKIITTNNFGQFDRSKFSGNFIKFIKALDDYHSAYKDCPDLTDRDRQVMNSASDFVKYAIQEAVSPN